ncbi:zinc ribbon domain-containing protein [Mycobacterium sp.]|jgi:hypothetical protein|uniref:zinc ribbon domain-containing protein n=1 Tax=Mycobacterium sp. TaxID=1785 RepID=UPI002D5DA5B8|nr:zinc ribbon domain-containing protein [Mycobacterium sp.]HZA09483.1 zinc ribbon domain-containing protein [Mycobacterium sp.]
MTADHAPAPPDRRYPAPPLRLTAFAPAPTEHVLLPRVASSLFPHLPPRSRRPFSVALAVLIVALIVFAVLRWQAPLIAVSTLGLPLLFMIYTYQADVAGGLPARGTLLLTAVLGAGLGVGWALLTGAIVARANDVALGPGMSRWPILVDGLVIPLGGAILMLVPAFVLRVLRPPRRESLDGFIIGSSGAIAFTAATILTLLAPQFATGLTADDRPVSVLLVEAGIRGVAMPLTAAAAGGLVGAALWFTRRADTLQWLPTLTLAVVVVLVLVLYAALGLIDVAPLPQGWQLALHLAVAVSALVALRAGLHVALLYETPDGGRAARSVRLTSHTRILLSFGAGLVLVLVAAVAVSAVVTPSAARYVCPPNCGRPPIGTPVEATPRFTSSNGDFSVSYPGPTTAYQATLRPNGLVLDFVGGDTGKLELFGEPAAGRTAKQVADDLIQQTYPDATVDYEIPNALVGYQLGYGVVADDYPQDSAGSYARLRVLVMVAVKSGLALVAAAIGPYHEFSPDFGNGHPSGANLQIAIDMGKYVNSFSWRGDPPR